MERTPVRVVTPGEEGQVPTSRSGEVVWETPPAVPPIPDTLDDLSDVDTTTTPATDGQALVWSDTLDQWVPGTVATGGGGGGDGGTPITPGVWGSTTVHRTTAPYTVPFPAGVDSTFDGLFVLVLHWLNTPADVLADLDALGQWDLLSWTGTGRLGSGPFMAILGGDPATLTQIQANVLEINAGGGACELSLLAVSDAVSFRDIPTSIASVVLDTCDSLTGWSSPSDATPFQSVNAGGYVAASAGQTGEWTQQAVLDRNIPLDFTETPLIAVKWHPQSTESPILNATATKNGVEQGLSVISTTNIDATWRRTVFEGPSGLGVASKVRFVAGLFGNGGEGYNLLIEQIDGIPSPHGTISQFVSSNGQRIESGIPAETGDLFLLAGGTNAANIELYNDLTGGIPVEVADSPAGNPSLTTRTWSVPVTTGGLKAPEVYSGSSEPGLGAVGISVSGGTTGGGGGGGSLPSGGVDGDVLTKQADGTAAWEEITFPPGLDAEQVRDIIASALVQGTGITVTVNDAGDTIAIASTVTPGLDAEAVRDLIGSTIVAGTNVTVTVNDAGDTVTINATPTTTEVIQDAVAALLAEGTGIDLTYDDAGNLLTIAATGSGGGTVDAYTKAEIGDITVDLVSLFETGLNP